MIKGDAHVQLSHKTREVTVLEMQRQDCRRKVLNSCDVEARSGSIP
jgi:hypothetical protein